MNVRHAEHEDAQDLPSADPPNESSTVCIGVGELSGEGGGLEASLEHVEKVTYRVKALGRDRIEFSHVDQR